MADYSATVTVPSNKLGDAWPPSPDGSGKVLVGPVLVDDAQPAATLARVVMTFSNGTRKFVADSDNPKTREAPITITNATTWTAEVPNIDEFLPVVGTWTWDMAFYPTGATNPITLYKGTLTVYQDA